MMEVLNLLSTFLLSLFSPAHPHVVIKFSVVKKCNVFFLDGLTPQIPGVLVNGIAVEQRRYKTICQMFKYTYRFATLYDMKNRIPVFSAYIYNGTDGKSISRPAWKIEPQLDQQIGPNMALANKWTNYRHQAVKEDYVGAENTHNVNRGHMFPKAFATDEETQISTFTLTNAVPQDKSCNNGPWTLVENEVKKTIKKNCDGVSYLVTGAVPSENNTLKGRVNIPSHLWTAYCCYSNTLKEWVAKAYLSNNYKKCIKKRMTLSNLYKELGRFYQRGHISLFSPRCPPKYDLMLAGEDEEVESGDGYGIDDDCAPL